MSLSSLTEHTLQRIKETVDEPLIEYMAKVSKTSSLNLIAHFSWGFDGSTGQAQYKQKFPGDSDNLDDHSIFATTIIPLRITPSDAKDIALWDNPTPQSVRYCRPLRLQFIKETKEAILEEKRWGEDQISRLPTFSFKLSNGFTVNFKCEFYLTVIDGKILNIIESQPSQQTCAICGATPSQFWDIDGILERPLKQSALKHGISPLHAWIRVLEFLLHLGYKIPFKKWRIPSALHDSFEQHRANIRKVIRQELGLPVDQVKPGGSGNTNDGNTSRRALSDQNRTRFAEILNVDRDLVNALHAILCAISSSHPINPEKFKEFGLSVARKYVAQYRWNHMPVTIHKILLHGDMIVRESLLPLGMLSEQAGESRNRLYALYRDQHAQKTSRIATLTDVFNRCLDSSDPLLSRFGLDERLKMREKNSFPELTMDLLQDSDDYLPQRELEFPSEALYFTNTDPTEDFENPFPELFLYEEDELLDV